MPTTCRVDLAGPLPAASVETLRSRFGAIGLRSSEGRTVLEAAVADQSAVQALLNLLWDAGGEVRCLRVVPGDRA